MQRQTQTLRLDQTAGHRNAMHRVAGINDHTRVTANKCPIDGIVIGDDQHHVCSSEMRFIKWDRVKINRVLFHGGELGAVWIVERHRAPAIL